MLIIKYDKYGETINDFYALDKVKDIIYKINNFEDDIELHISNENILDLILGAMMQKEISSDKVKLFCNDIEIRIDSKGELRDEMPFCMGDLTYKALFGLDKDMFKIRQ